MYVQSNLALVFMVVVWLALPPSNILADDLTVDISDKATPDVIVVVGAGGTSDYEAMFEKWASTWKSNCETAALEFKQIGPISKTDSVTVKDELQSTLKMLDGSDLVVEPIWIILIGHGTWDGKAAKLNLAGPDMSAEDLDSWLDSIRRPVILANCTSSSAPFINRISSPGRVVITATRNGSEHNFAIFGRYLAEAFAAIDADLNHDDEVSAKEAFIRASIETKRFYDEQGRLASEHSLIDDNSDKQGSDVELVRGLKTAGPKATVDGAIADSFSILVNPNVTPLASDQKAERQRIEAELARLKTEFADESKGKLREAALPLLIQLAELYEVNSP
ncbi:hypothetical protein LOC67_13915 [Stieleria sp. JC731]|nr:hypothetical protein [Stieleria sp. JC731]MCC9601650.1 hypothetical protein [Stieleria sp. JC731]